MVRRLAFLLPLVLATACDPEEPTLVSQKIQHACLLGSGSEPKMEIWLLPTFEDAKRFDDATKNRRQGAVNLVLAKYGDLSVSGGAVCRLLGTKGEFSQVRAEKSGLVGWIPTVHLRVKE